MKAKGEPASGELLDLWVQPRASRNEIQGYRENYLRLRVTAAPAGGEANELCRKLLAEALGVPASNVEILRGHKSRRKRVRIRDVEPARLAALGRGLVDNP